MTKLDNTHKRQTTDNKRKAISPRTQKQELFPPKTENGSSRKHSKKALPLAAALLLAIVAVGTFFLIDNPNAPAGNPTEPTAQNAQSDNGINEQNSSSALREKTSDEPQKTAAGNQAVAHTRTTEERMATSESANDVKPGPKTVYLTFDDGPSSNTPRILEILNAYGVKATWFVKGDQPQIGYVKDIWNEGNQIAIHTYTHNYKQVYADADSYWSDLHQTGLIIKDQIGFEPTLVRFPGGSRNSFNGDIADGILERMANERYHYFDWNVSSGDGGDHDASFLEEYTINQAQGCHSCCVLMHDSAAKDTTVEALPTIIEWFIDNGFEFDVLLADSFGYHF